MAEEPNSVPRMGKRMELMESLVKRMEAPVSWQVFSKILMEVTALSNLEYICVILVGEKRCCMGWPRKPTGAFFSLPYASMTFPSLSPGSSRQAMAPTQTNRSTWVWPIDGGKKRNTVCKTQLGIPSPAWDPLRAGPRWVLQEGILGAARIWEEIKGSDIQVGKKLHLENHPQLERRADDGEKGTRRLSTVQHWYQI